MMSNKPDGKEQNLNEDRTYSMEASGRFLKGRKNRKERHKRSAQCLAMLLLLAWDGLLLYMIVERLIEPVYGAAFVAVVSVYLGMKL